MFVAGIELRSPSRSLSDVLYELKLGLARRSALFMVCENEDIIGNLRGRGEKEWKKEA